MANRRPSQDCMRQDEALFKIAERVKNFAVIYLCDIDQVRTRPPSAPTVLRGLEGR